MTRILLGLVLTAAVFGVGLTITQVVSHAPAATAYPNGN